MINLRRAALVCSLVVLTMAGGWSALVLRAQSAGRKPVASAGLNQTVDGIGTSVQLDGSGSSDPAGLALNYHWTIDWRASTNLTHEWGMTGDIPTPGDYDGDGRTDLAVFRPSNGRWYVRKPSYDLPFGLADDIPVPADYDGDGITDIALWRPSIGVWYVLQSSSKFRGSNNTRWGAPGDIPILRRP